MGAKTAKIFRDPLYNYISIDRDRDAWLLKLLDSPELQRLRRIHQLGVSYLTYPGADHNRLAHSLGVLHLMQQALQHLSLAYNNKEEINQARAPLLATALLHDVGHGPFSHLFEPCLGIDHEVWSKKIVLDEATVVHKTLKAISSYLPKTVADLIDTDNIDHSPWQKALLSSQLDVDRLDYLRRDSLFTGAGYGHFDHFRILNTIELHGSDAADLAWPEKSKLAIEEYVFARYYMYQNVYLHHTTRGFEKMIEAMWRHGKKLRDDGIDVKLVPALKAFWKAGGAATVSQYLAIEEFTVLQQIQEWSSHSDKALSFLARSFLTRDRFCAIDPPPSKNDLMPGNVEWEEALKSLMKSSGFDPDCYCLKDQVKGKYHQPYFPEKESDEQSARNAIRLINPITDSAVEISKVLSRLKPVTQRPLDQIRFYVPREMHDAARKLRSEWGKPRRRRSSQRKSEARGRGRPKR